MSDATLRQASRRAPLSALLPNQANILGAIGLRCRLTLRIELAKPRPPKPVSFLVDSGASFSVIGLSLAEYHNIPVPPPESEVDVPVQTTLGTSFFRVRPGRIRAWWNDELDGYPFDWPVLFRVGGPPNVPPILGLGGVVNTCRWTFDGRYALDAPHGYLSLDDTR